MLKAVHDSLELKMSGFGHDVNARFKQVDARFNEVDARFNEVDARFNEIDARFNQVDARFDKVDARFNRVDARLETIESKIDAVLARVTETAIDHEAQRGENRIVFEGLQGVRQRQDRVEAEVQKMDNTLRYLASSKPEQGRN